MSVMPVLISMYMIEALERPILQPVRMVQFVQDISRWSHD